MRLVNYSNFVSTNGSKPAHPKQQSHTTMNHLLHQITWHQYLTAAFIIAVIYYLAIIFRCYKPELHNLQKRISGQKPDEPLQALQYQAAEEELPASPKSNYTEQRREEQSISDTDILAGKLKA